jgi:hypothetical protein
MIKLLFCHDPLVDKQADARFIHEARAAASLGLDHHLLDHEAIMRGNMARAVRHVPWYREETLAIFRGWEMPERHYDLLYEALLSRGLRLVNTPDQYVHTLYLPEALPTLSEHTPHTVVLRGDGSLTTEEVLRALTPFAGKPVILRDFVHCQKHRWGTACLIRASDDPQQVEAAMMAFLELQDRPVGGWVFREYVELTPLAPTLPDHMPLSLEYRLVYADGVCVAALHHWDARYEGAAPPLEQFVEIARQVHSRFFTMDVAQRSDGAWIVLDLGDAQMISLLAQADVRAFYQAVIDQFDLPSA